MIKTNNISVGISLDGPKHVHDIYRKYKDGRGSFDVVMNNLNKLTHEKIRCGFLSVVCDETLAQLIETVKWFSNIGITYIDIKPYFQSDDRVTLSVEKYAQKMLELLNWLKENPNRIYVREFDTFANAICGNKKRCRCVISGIAGQDVTILLWTAMETFIYVIDYWVIKCTFSEILRKNIWMKFFQTL